MIWNTLVYFRNQRPEAPAVLLSGGAISYRRFTGDIARVTHALRDRIAPGTRVAAIDVKGLYLHWLCILALMRLRVTSASLSADFGMDVIRPDLLITDSPVAADMPVVLAQTEWLAEPLPRGEFASRQDEGDFPARLLASSGTTGRPKRIVWPLKLIEQRSLHYGAFFDFSNGTRMGLLAGVATAGGYQFPIACWLRGGLVVQAAEPLLNPAVPEALRPNFQLTSTGHYERLTNMVSGDGPAFPQTRFFVGGSAVAPSVAARGRRRLSPHLHIVYGSTEAGMVSLTGDGELVPYSVGHLLPQVELQLVDGEGAPVAPGQVGEVRVRTPFAIAGYDDDPEATGLAFRGGWFHPGDLGMISKDGQLLIVGRTSELFNIGGRKLSPTLVDEAALACPGVLEAGSCLVKDSNGDQAVAIGVKAGHGYAREAVIKAIRKDIGLPRFMVMEIDEVPRNEMGKILRGQLAEAIIAAEGAMSEQAAERGDIG